MKFILKKVTTLFTFLIIVITMTTAHSADFLSQEGISHTVLTLLDDPRKDEPWSRLITTQKEWESFFNVPLAYMTFPQSEAPTAPQLDFENFQVLTGGIGEKPNGGFILSVKSVQELDDEINIHVLYIKPGATCFSIEMISYPSVSILIKKTDKPIRFTVSQSTSEC